MTSEDIVIPHRHAGVDGLEQPQEIAVELIGEEAQKRILFWEAAEGGNGIWPRMIETLKLLLK